MSTIIKVANTSLQFEASNNQPPECIRREGNTFIWRAVGVQMGNIDDINKSIRLKVTSVKDWNKWYENLPKNTHGKLVHRSIFGE